MRSPLIFLCLLMTLNNAAASCLDPSLVQSKGSKIDLSAARVTDEKGQTSSITQVGSDRGITGDREISGDSEVTILHFWATWCAPCLKELPLLDASLQQAKQRGYRVVPVNTVVTDVDESTELYNRLGITNLPLLFDVSDLFHQLKLLGMPATIAFDANGLEIKRAYGELSWNCDALLSELSN